MKAKIAALLHSPKGQRGQSLVELAISLTVMLLLLSGAVTFGMALFSFVALRDAAQEGALYGSFNPNNPSDPTMQTINISGITTRVQNASTSPIYFLNAVYVDPGAYPDPSQDLSFTIDTTNHSSGAPLACEGTGTNGPNGIQVSITYRYHIIMPFVGAIVGDTIPLHATVTDTILEPKCP